MPPITGIHHFGLTVRDVEASAAWYQKVLGFTRVGDFAAADGARRKVFLRHEGLGVRLGLTQHLHGHPEPFDETVVGLDHLAFRVERREDLDAWAEHLDEHRVTRSPIAAANSVPGAAVLVFRDPDNIQLEVFTDPAS
jgi:catechol 2,3-dioxygenase-like lactoylglutathione lyase family enzyme